MEQAAARALCREIAQRRTTIVVATTADAYHGRWESTHTWGVNTGTRFISDETEVRALFGLAKTSV